MFLALVVEGRGRSEGSAARPAARATLPTLATRIASSAASRRVGLGRPEVAVRRGLAAALDFGVPDRCVRYPANVAQDAGDKSRFGFAERRKRSSVDKV